MAGKTESSKKKPNPKPIAEDETLKSDIANFASSLFSTSGFSDSDFHKKGPLKHQSGKKESNSDKSNGKSFDIDKKNPQLNKRENPNPNFKPQTKPKPSVLSTHETTNGFNQKGYGKFKNLPKLPLVKASALGVWYVDLEELEKKVIGERREKRVEVKNVDEWKAFVEKKRELGEILMVQYARDYESSRGQSGDIKMLVATQRSGTAADKVSAFSVMVGDNPVANLRSLDGLLGLVTSKVGKRHALTGFEVLKELFVSNLLPDRKLKNLLQRPLNDVPETKDGYSLLLFWYWEECLKQRYERFIFALEEASRDMLPVLKDKALKTIYALLKSKSEQERRLLSALVNKLGDPQNRGASNADFHLSNLLSEHPNMKAVVIDEVDSFLFRPHLGLRAKYHAVNFLSQIRLSNKGDGPNVAKRLIDVYFALFKVLVTEAGGDKERNKHGEKNLKWDSKLKDMEDNALDSHVELDSRILSVLLTGINRAFPFVSSNAADDIVEVQTPLLFQLVHSRNFNIGVQALMLLDKISSKNQVVSDRFYRALYSKLLLPAAMNSSKKEMFIGLLLRAMKNDVNLKRVAAFSKRLLQVALQQPPQYACGYLFLLSEILRARPPLWNVVQQNESVDDGFEHFEDIVEETDNEASAVPKEQQDKVERSRSDDSDSDSDSASVDKDESPDTDSEDEMSDEADELVFADVSNDVQNPGIPDESKQQSEPTPTDSFLSAGYNPRHREPSYCNADRVSWWELMVLASHCHPSVAAMARTLLSGVNIVYNGNPLNDLSLTSFLDKFMEKKPKQNEWHGGSQIEPAKKLDMNNHFIGPEILSLAETDVPPEDVVFHKFYMNKMNSTKKQKKKKKKKGAEDEDEAAEELFDVDDGEKYDEEVEGGDESDNEEIENMLDAADVSSDGDGEYNYDDLDDVANEDDDLIGNASDAEGDMPFDIEGYDIDINDADDDESEGNDDIAIGDADDGSDDEDSFHPKKGKRKSRGKKGQSPFASLEEYEHLINEADGPSSNSKSSTKSKSKSRKKKKQSK